MTGAGFKATAILCLFVLLSTPSAFASLDDCDLSAFHLDANNEFAYATLTPPLNFESYNGHIWANGKPFYIQGINWSGFETATHVVMALWLNSLECMIDFLATNHFNAVRIPLAIDSILNNSPISGLDPALNPEFTDLGAMQALHVVIRKLAARNILVMLDNHRMSDTYPPPPLWWDDNYDKETVLRAIGILADDFCKYWNVFAFDLKNEPHQDGEQSVGSTWGTGEDTDWDLGAAFLGNFIHERCPRWLIFVEGIGFARYVNWGSDFTRYKLLGHATDVKLKDQSKLVWSPHLYGPSLHHMYYFETPDFPNGVAEIYDLQVGWLVNFTGHAVVVGEWGGWYDSKLAQYPKDKIWGDYFVSYLNARDWSCGFFWVLNPDSVDTGGILEHDWRTPIQGKVNLLRRCKSTDVGSLIPTPSPTSTPTASPTALPTGTALPTQYFNMSIPTMRPTPICNHWPTARPVPGIPGIIKKQHPSGVRTVISAAALFAVYDWSPNGASVATQHENAINLIFKGQQGLNVPPLVQVSGTSSFQVDLRYLENGDTIVHVFNWDINKSVRGTISFLDSSILYGKVVQNMMTGAIVMPLGDMYIDVTVPAAASVMLIARASGEGKPTVYMKLGVPLSLAPMDSSVGIPLEVEPAGRADLRAYVEVFDLVNKKVRYSVTDDQIIDGHDSNRTLQLYMTDFDPSDPTFKSSSKGGKYEFRARLIASNGEIVAEERRPVLVAWTVQPSNVVVDIFAKRTREMTFMWEDLPVGRREAFPGRVLVYNSTKTQMIDSSHYDAVLRTCQMLESIGFVKGFMKPETQLLEVLGPLYFISDDTLLDADNKTVDLSWGYLDLFFQVVILPKVSVMNSAEMNNLQKWLHTTYDSVLITLDASSGYYLNETGSIRPNDFYQGLNFLSLFAGNDIMIDDETVLSGRRPLPSPVPIIVPSSDSIGVSVSVTNPDHPITRRNKDSKFIVRATSPSGPIISSLVGGGSTSVPSLALGSVSSKSLVLGSLQYDGAKQDIPAFIVNTVGLGKTLLFNFDASMYGSRDLWQSAREWWERERDICKMDIIVRCPNNQIVGSVRNWVVSGSGSYSVNVTRNRRCVGGYIVENALYPWYKDAKKDRVGFYTSQNDLASTKSFFGVTQDRFWMYLCAAYVGLLIMSFIWAALYSSVVLFFRRRKQRKNDLPIHNMTVYNTILSSLVPDHLLQKKKFVDEEPVPEKDDVKEEKKIWDADVNDPTEKATAAVESDVQLPPGSRPGTPKIASSRPGTPTRPSTPTRAGTPTRAAAATAAANNKSNNANTTVLHPAMLTIARAHPLVSRVMTNLPAAGHRLAYLMCTSSDRWGVQPSIVELAVDRLATRLLDEVSRKAGNRLHRDLWVAYELWLEEAAPSFEFKRPPGNSVQIVDDLMLWYIIQIAVGSIAAAKSLPLFVFHVARQATWGDAPLEVCPQPEALGGWMYQLADQVYKIMCFNFRRAEMLEDVFHWDDLEDLFASPGFTSILMNGVHIYDLLTDIQLFPSFLGRDSEYLKLMRLVMDSLDGYTLSTFLLRSEEERLEVLTNPEKIEARYALMVKHRLLPGTFDNAETPKLNLPVGHDTRQINLGVPLAHQNDVENMEEDLERARKAFVNRWKTYFEKSKGFYGIVGVAHICGAFPYVVLLHLLSLLGVAGLAIVDSEQPPETGRYLGIAVLLCMVLLIIHAYIVLPWWVQPHGRRGRRVNHIDPLTMRFINWSVWLTVVVGSAIFGYYFLFRDLLIATASLPEDVTFIEAQQALGTVLAVVWKWVTSLLILVGMMYPFFAIVAGFYAFIIGFTIGWWRKRVSWFWSWDVRATVGHMGISMLGQELWERIVSSLLGKGKTAGSIIAGSSDAAESKGARADWEIQQMGRRLLMAKDATTKEIKSGKTRLTAPSVQQQLAAEVAQSTGSVTVESMRRINVVIPVFGEAAIYSWDFLATPTDTKGCVLGHIISRNNQAWQALCKAIGEQYTEELEHIQRAAVLGHPQKPSSVEVEALICRWASQQFQPLSRTIDGAMEMGDALLLLAAHQKLLEASLAAELSSVQHPDTDTSGDPDTEDDKAAAAALQIVRDKFRVYVAAQDYESNHQLRSDLEGLMRDYPEVLCVAYSLYDEQSKQMICRLECFSTDIDYTAPLPHMGDREGKQRTEMPEGGVMGQQQGGIKVMYEVPLPGPPFETGFGKPMNQLLVSMFFDGTAGLFLDSNQDCRFADSLVTPSILARFDRDPDAKVIGVPDYVPTRDWSWIAWCSAFAELIFGMQTQRILEAMGVRLHYGHSDYVDLSFCETQAGFCKLSYVSEDVFLGLETISRGYDVTRSEAQMLGKSRDVDLITTSKFNRKISWGAAQLACSRHMHRTATAIGPMRQLSLYYGLLGNYVSQVLLQFSMILFVVGSVLSEIIFPVAHLSDPFLRGDDPGYVFWGVLVSLGLGVPGWLHMVEQHGLFRGTFDYVWHLPALLAYNLFQWFNLAHFFRRGLRRAAQYIASNRTTGLDHMDSDLLDKFFDSTHIQIGFLLVVCATACIIAKPTVSYVVVLAVGLLSMYLVFLTNHGWRSRIGRDAVRVYKSANRTYRENRSKRHPLSPFRLWDLFCFLLHVVRITLVFGGLCIIAGLVSVVEYFILLFSGKAKNSNDKVEALQRELESARTQSRSLQDRLTALTKEMAETQAAANGRKSAARDPSMQHRMQRLNRELFNTQAELTNVDMVLQGLNTEVDFVGTKSVPRPSTAASGFIGARSAAPSMPGTPRHQGQVSSVPARRLRHEDL
mmetsp:Transcript_1670/g.2530  ORF Transcript_1670/g.2530 Transcript_1670/m.2530 type:complete len:2764 (-) Transcript_1670:466-8757(-)